MKTYRCALQTCQKEITGPYAMADIGYKLVFCDSEMHEPVLGEEVPLSSFSHAAQYAIHSRMTIMAMRMPLSEIKEKF